MRTLKRANQDQIVRTSMILPAFLILLFIFVHSLRAIQLGRGQINTGSVSTAAKNQI